MTSQWKNDDYTTIFLTTLYQAMTNRITLVGELNSPLFYESFTNELNFRIRESLPPGTIFRNFAPHEVTTHGLYLRSTYKRYKCKVDVDVHFPTFNLYRRVFRKPRRTLPKFPDKETMLGIKIKRSFITRIIRGSGKTAAQAATRLNTLVSWGLITHAETVTAIAEFIDYGSCILWLEMNRDDQVNYVKSLGEGGED